MASDNESDYGDPDVSGGSSSDYSGEESDDGKCTHQRNNLNFINFVGEDWDELEKRAAKGSHSPIFF